jgi:hypothetical protein
MTHHLNSILLEGKVSSLPVADPSTGVTSFNLQSTYPTRLPDNSKVEETLACLIYTTDTMPISSFATLKPGQSIRIVGYLAQKDNKLLVVAEHINSHPLQASPGYQP